MLVRTYQRRKRGASQGDASQDSPWDSQESLLGSSQDSFEEDPDQPPSQSHQWNGSASEYECSLLGTKDSLDNDSQTSQGKSSAAAAAASILMPPPSMRSRGKGKASSSKEVAKTWTLERTGLDKKRNADQAIATVRGKVQKTLSAVEAATRADSAGDDSQSDRIGVQADKGFHSKEAVRVGTLKSGSNNAFSSWIDVPAGPLSTLTDAQDRGQMIEYIDEANFAMSGLCRGQAVRMIRASLVTMAQLCKSTESRRLLRNHGFHRPLLEAVLDLELGDPALSLGAAAILYFLAIDEGHDTDIWESKKCLQFLFRLLHKFSVPEDNVGGVPPPPPPLNAGGARGKKSGFIRPSKASDSGADVIEKLRDLFRKQEQGDDGEDGVGDKDINSTRLALLTLQKACSSPIVLEEVGSGAGGGRAAKSVEKFKERLREEGGLEAVAGLASHCLAEIQATAQDGKKRRESAKGCGERVEVEQKMAETSGMLLRCLRVMENVTFLNQANQRHLIQLVVVERGGRRGEASRPFIALLLDAIDTLSAVDSQDSEQIWQSPGRRESGREGNHSDAKSSGRMGMGMAVREGYAAAAAAVVDDDGSGNATEGGRSKQVVENEGEEKRTEQEMKTKSRQTAVSVFAKRRKFRNSEEPSEKGCPASSRMTEITELKASKMVEASRYTSVGDGSDGKKGVKDPFDFDEDSDADDQVVVAVDADSRIRKHGKQEAGRPKRTLSPSQVDHSPLPLTPMKEQREEGMADRGGERQVERGACAPPSPAYRAVGRLASSADSVVHGVVENCLISAVKVLMNLSNENMRGCRQVALAGGLQTISALAVTCCRSVALSVGVSSKKSVVQHSVSSTESGEVKAKSEQCGYDDMDLLIVVLGVLVNLVERDERNRTELAGLECPLMGERGRNVGMVPFLCALFASKHGASEVHKEREEHAHEVEAEVNADVNQREAEAMMVEAYAALLLAFLSRAGADSYATVVQSLPGGGLDVLVPVLEHFFAFHQSLNAITPESYASAKALIESMRKPE